MQLFTINWSRSSAFHSLVITFAVPDCQEKSTRKKLLSASSRHFSALRAIDGAYQRSVGRALFLHHHYVHVPWFLHDVLSGKGCWCFMLPRKTMQKPSRWWQTIGQHCRWEHKRSVFLCAVAGLQGVFFSFTWICTQRACFCRYGGLWGFYCAHKRLFGWASVNETFFLKIYISCILASLIFQKNRILTAASW